MKNNTKKLLLWLYPAATTHRLVPLSEVQALLSDLTPGGQRSLVFHLEQTGLLAKEQVVDQVYCRVTQAGIRALYQEFPVLNPARHDWQGEWSVIAFLEAPANDKQFRYLRTQLLKYQTAQLNRGLYLYPGKLPSELTQLLQNMYATHIVVWESKSWMLGDERAIVSQHYLLSDILTTYSGISREVDELLDAKKEKKPTIDTAKQPIFLVFDRLVMALVTDLGLHHYYYPQVPAAVELLAKLQHLVASE